MVPKALCNKLRYGHISQGVWNLIKNADTGWHPLGALLCPLSFWASHLHRKCSRCCGSTQPRRTLQNRQKALISLHRLQYQRWYWLECLPLHCFAHRMHQELVAVCLWMAETKLQGHGHILRFLVLQMGCTFLGQQNCQLALCCLQTCYRTVSFHQQVCHRAGDINQ